MNYINEIMTIDKPYIINSSYIKSVYNGEEIWFKENPSPSSLGWLAINADNTIQVWIDREYIGPYHYTWVDVCDNNDKIALMKLILMAFGER